MKPDLCIHHAPCADGFMAAWAIRQRWPDCRFHAGVYGQEPPDVTGLDVLIVDFSYKRPVLEAMGWQARSITVLDHHKSAEADLALFGVGALADLMPPQTLSEVSAFQGVVPVQAYFDMDRSGAMLAWNYAFPDQPPPRLVQHVQDRDLWRFELAGTREIQAVLFSYPYDFDEWSRLVERCERPDGHKAMVHAGLAIERKHHKDVAELLNITRREMVIGGQRVPVANLPYTMASDAANILAAGAPFGACYYDNAEGARVFSLRSVEGGADVSLIASAYGGGGQAKAAGFTAPKGWEGDAA